MFKFDKELSVSVKTLDKESAFTLLTNTDDSAEVSGFMPTYDYKCDSCGDQFEVFQSMNDAPLTKCSKCGGAIRRLFSSAGIIFKGSGFYVNDYKSSSSSPSSTSDSPKVTACDGCKSKPK